MQMEFEHENGDIIILNYDINETDSKDGVEVHFIDGNRVIEWTVNDPTEQKFDNSHYFISQLLGEERDEFGEYSYWFETFSSDAASFLVLNGIHQVILNKIYS